MSDPAMPLDDTSIDDTAGAAPIGRMSKYRSDRSALVVARRARVEALAASRQAKAEHAELKASKASAKAIRESRSRLDARVAEYYQAQSELNRLRADTQEGERNLVELQEQLDDDEFTERDLVVAPGPAEARLATIDLRDEAAPTPAAETTTPLLEATDVSKKFATNLDQSLRYGLADLGRLAIGRKPKFHALRDEEFWAVRDINLKLNRGDSLGILGSNGSGKSTLVKILAGILAPDEGEVTVRGRLTSVVSVGAGFHPHLSGLENIRVNAAVLGIEPDELDQLEPEIIAFSGLGERLYKPVGMYSSGMRMRLGFAVATAVDPDVMIFDEVLAVGDQRFRNRCIERMAELREGAATVMVSQSPVMLGNYCSQAIWLDGGEVRGFGSIDDVGDAYLEASELGTVH